MRSPSQTIVANPDDFEVESDTDRRDIKIQHHTPSQNRYFVKKVKKHNFESVAKQILYSNMIRDLFGADCTTQYMLACKDGELLQYSKEIPNSTDILQLGLATRQPVTDRSELEGNIFDKMTKQDVNNFAILIATRALLADMDNTIDNMLITFNDGHLKAVAIDMDYMCKDYHSNLEDIDWQSAESIVNKGMKCIQTAIDLEREMAPMNENSIKKALVKTVDNGIKQGEITKALNALKGYKFGETLAGVRQELKAFAEQNGIEDADVILSIISEAFERQQAKVDKVSLSDLNQPTQSTKQSLNIAAFESITTTKSRLASIKEFSDFVQISFHTEALKEIADKVFENIIYDGSKTQFYAFNSKSLYLDKEKLAGKEKELANRFAERVIIEIRTVISECEEELKSQMNRCVSDNERKQDLDLEKTALEGRDILKKVGEIQPKTIHDVAIILQQVSMYKNQVSIAIDSYKSASKRVKQSKEMRSRLNSLASEASMDDNDYMNKISRVLNPFEGIDECRNDSDIVTIVFEARELQAIAIAALGQYGCPPMQTNLFAYRDDAIYLQKEKISGKTGELKTKFQTELTSSWTSLREKLVKKIAFQQARCVDGDARKNNTCLRNLKICGETLVNRLNQSVSNQPNDIAVAIVDTNKYCESVSEAIRLFKGLHTDDTVEDKLNPLVLDASRYDINQLHESSEIGITSDALNEILGAYKSKHFMNFFKIKPSYEIMKLRELVRNSAHDANFTKEDIAKCIELSVSDKCAERATKMRNSDFLGKQSTGTDEVLMKIQEALSTSKIESQHSP